MGTQPQRLPLQSNIDSRAIYAALYGQAAPDINAPIPGGASGALPTGPPVQTSAPSAAANAGQISGAFQRIPGGSDPGSFAAAMQGLNAPPAAPPAPPPLQIPSALELNLYGRSALPGGQPLAPPPLQAPSAAELNLYGKRPAGLTPEPPRNPQWDYLNAQFGPGGNAPVPGPPVAPVPLSTREKVLLGLFGALNPIAGLGIAERLAARPREFQQQTLQYQRQLPAVQEQANQAAYQRAGETSEAFARAGEAQAAAGTQQAEQKRIQFEMGVQQQTAKANALQQIMDEKGSGKYSDADLQTRWQQMATANPRLGLTQGDIQSAISQSPRTVAAAQPIRGMDGFVVGMQLPSGKQLYGADMATAAPEIQQAFRQQQTAQTQAWQRNVNMEMLRAQVQANQQVRVFEQQGRMVEARQTADRYKELSGDYDTALAANERLSQMEESKLHPNAQNDLALLMNHIGMTLGAQKGARFNEARIREAEQARGVADGTYVELFTKLRSGEMLSPTQREQMVNLGREARNMAWQRASQKAQIWGLAPPAGAAAVASQPVLPSSQVPVAAAPTPGGKLAIPPQQMPSWPAAPPGATHVVPGPDGKNHYTNAAGTVDLGVAK